MKNLYHIVELLKYDYIKNKKSLILFTVLIASIFVLFTLFKVFSINISNIDNNLVYNIDIRDIVYLPDFSKIFLLGLLYLSVHSFSFLKQKNEAIVFMVLPPTRLEKFIYKISFLLIVYPILFFAVISSLSFILYIILLVVGTEVFFEFNKYLNLDNLSYILIISSFFSTGSILFKKNSFIKTILFIIILSIGVFIVTVIFTMIYSEISGNFNLNISIKDTGVDLLNGPFTYLIISVILYPISFRKFLKTNI